LLFIWYSKTNMLRIINHKQDIHSLHTKESIQLHIAGYTLMGRNSMHPIRRYEHRNENTYTIGVYVGGATLAANREAEQ